MSKKKEPNKLGCADVMIIFIVGIFLLTLCLMRLSAVTNPGSSYLSP